MQTGGCERESVGRISRLLHKDKKQIFRLIRMTFAITAAALEAVDLKHLEILRRKGLWVDFNRAAHFLLREALAQTKQLYGKIGRNTDS